MQLLGWDLFIIEFRENVHQLLFKISDLLLFKNFTPRQCLVRSKRIAHAVWLRTPQLPDRAVIYSRQLKSLSALLIAST